MANATDLKSGETSSRASTPPSATLKNALQVDPQDEQLQDLGQVVEDDLEPVLRDDEIAAGLGARQDVVCAVALSLEVEAVLLHTRADEGREEDLAEAPNGGG